MKVIVSGKNVEIGDSLTQYAEEKLQEHVKRYFEHAINSNITISKDGALYKADILVNEGTGTGVILKGSAKDYEVYKCFDSALEKITKQLRRYKTRIKDHRKRKASEINFSEGTKYVIEATEGEQIGSAPTIIEEKTTNLESLTVSDAVMKMDLLNLPALIFINSANNHFNAVYYRKDGNISWVDSKIPAFKP